jgi:DNA recombination protein RmuC
MEITSFIIGLFAGALFAGVLVFLFFRTQISAKDQELKQAQLNHQNSQQMSEKFENLANRIFDDKSTKFADQNLKNLSVLLDPFKERLKDFEKKVEDTYSTERAERGSLRGELGKLMELNIRMSSDAQNLTKALKGDNKTMGNWGELILENILERSGLRKGEEYIVQGTDMGLKNDQGKDIRPDVIINLPDGKHLIVDAKVSLKDYEIYVQSEETPTRDLAAKAHVDSLRRHIKGLSEKKYYSADKLISPDFVLLFMPIEPAFALAFKLNPDLLQEAWDKNICLVSPTTLLTTLRTVSAIWKQERQERNALEIARQGGALYDKFAGLVEDMNDLGTKVQNVQKTHSQIMNKLVDGNGNLLKRVETLRELGAKTEKRLAVAPSNPNSLS